MRLILLATAVAWSIASAIPTTFICIVMPDDPVSPYPPIGALHAFMVQESVDRLVNPDRETILFAPGTSSYDQCFVKVDARKKVEKFN